MPGNFMPGVQDISFDIVVICCILRDVEGPGDIRLAIWALVLCVEKDGLPRHTDIFAAAPRLRRAHGVIRSHGTDAI